MENLFDLIVGIFEFDVGLGVLAVGSLISGVSLAVVIASKVIKTTRAAIRQSHTWLRDSGRLVKAAGATPELAREPPALVNLLMTRGRITRAAVQATLLDLAARGAVTFYQPDNDTGSTVVLLGNRDVGDLTPYERMVMDELRVAGRVGEPVRMATLGFLRPRGMRRWHRRFRRAVQADARERGLTRLDMAMMSTIVNSGAVPCILGGFVCGQGGAILMIIVFVVASIVIGERTRVWLSDAGRVSLANWLGVREWLRAHEVFADLPASAVAVWGRVRRLRLRDGRHAAVESSTRRPRSSGWCAPRGSGERAMGVKRGIERKYDVPAGFRVPDLSPVPGVASLGAPAEHRLDAAYFDTSELSLARNRAPVVQTVSTKTSPWPRSLGSSRATRRTDRRRGVRMKATSPLRIVVTGTTALALIVMAATAASSSTGSRAAIAPAAAITGPSTTTRPYVLPGASGVRITSLLTVNDVGAADNGYEMVGIPDGIGTRWQGGKIVAFVNHELRTSTGIPRRHGVKGAFVSKMTIDHASKRVVKGEDLIDPGVRYWNYAAGAYSSSPSPAWTINGVSAPAQAAEFARFCSGSLTDPLQMISRTSLRGYLGQIYFANEENGDESRAFGVTTDGAAYQLPRLGLFSWENTIAAATRGDTTLVMGNEDAATGQLWAYVGTKRYTGSPMDKAGLTNGENHVFDIVDQAVTNDVQFRATYGKGTPAAVTFKEVDWTLGGAAQNALAAANGLTLNRIEDGSFDPLNRNDYYFVTTEGGVGASVSNDPAFPAPNTVGNGRDGGGLWRLRFKNVDRPELGGTLELLLDGSESIGLNKPDNITIDGRGNLLIQEDPGNNVHLARVVSFRIADTRLGVVAQFDPALFGRDAALTGSPSFLTMDEESSGVVSTSQQFGSDTFLFDAQVHTASGLPAGPGPATVEEYVENGQLLLLKVTSWTSVYGTRAPHGTDQEVSDD